MLVVWQCRSCGAIIARAEAGRDEAWLSALTELEEEYIIKNVPPGGITVSILCEACLPDEGLETGSSGTGFMQGTWLH